MHPALATIKQTALTTIRHYVTPTSLLYGFGGACALYLLIFLILGLNAGKTVEKLESKLASESIEIARVRENTPNLPTHPENHIAQNTAQAETFTLPVHKGDSLRPAPVEGLHKDGKHGLLPVKGPDGTTPYDAYRKPFSVTGKSLIAIVVLDFGLDGTLSKEVLSTLPSEISLVLSPYSNAPNQFQRQARKQGHELWLDLPMQTESYPYKDPGPRGILVSGGLQYNLDNLHWTLSRTAGYAGIAAFTDSTFDVSTTLLKSLFGTAFDRGLGYLELNPEASAIVETVALFKETPYIRNSLSINNVSLKALESAAKDKGFVVAAFSPSPNGLKSLQTWLKTLDAKGFALAPLSAVSDLGASQK